jgi:hypothetical protein
MLQKWEGKWQMAFNADKCFVIRAGTNRKTIKQDYTSVLVYFLSAPMNISLNET